MIPEPTLSIVMPALNEERAIHSAVRSTLAAFDELDVAGEVIVIDDGSTDSTGMIVADESARDERVRLVRHEKPQGVGASFWDGVRHARGEFVCMLPGDNENDPVEIIRYLELMDHVDIVVPFVLNKETRSAFRNALSYAYQTIINTSFRVRFNYTNGTVLYRRCVLDEVTARSSGFFYQTDLLVRLVKRGYLFAEVPYRLKIREHGQSRAISLKSLWCVMRGYLRLVKDVYLGRRRARPEPYADDSQTAKRRTHSAATSQDAAQASEEVPSGPTRPR